jgi:hypothetical protein
VVRRQDRRISRDRADSPVRMMVGSDHPDRRLRGYVGELVDVRGHEALVRFLIKIQNEVAETWIPLRFLRRV